MQPQQVWEQAVLSMLSIFGRELFYSCSEVSTDEMAKGLACPPLEQEIVNSTRGRLIPKTIIKMVPIAVWLGTLQHTDMSRESNSRGYQLTSPQLYPLLEMGRG
jgi:hypothetical protein